MIYPKKKMKKGTFNGGNGFKNFGFAFLACNIKFHNGFSYGHGKLEKEYNGGFLSEILVELCNEMKAIYML